MVNDVGIVEVLSESRLVAIIRGDDAGHARATAITLLESGFRALEVTLTTPGALDLIRELSGGDASIGGGTVLTQQDAQDVASAGGRFIVTPGLAPSIAESGRLGLPSLAGAFTASEVIAAVGMGAAAVKLFPADLGGPDYLRALRAPLPDIRFIPVGGVTLHLAPEFLAAGAFALGLGSPLVGDAVRGGDLAALRDRAAAFIETAVR